MFCKYLVNESLDLHEFLYGGSEVHYAAKNLFTAAESALEHQPNLKKVVIMTLTPRYDTRMSDPRALKPILAHMFNNTLRELWLNSSTKDKVTIGLHNLECVGGGPWSQVQGYKEQ